MFLRTWNSKKAMIVGGVAATEGGKSKERRTGGECKKAGKSAKIAKRCSWETDMSFNGCM